MNLVISPKVLTFDKNITSKFSVDNKILNVALLPEVSSYLTPLKPPIFFL